VRRRQFITMLSGASVAWPLVARAEQPTMPVIGFLNSASSAPYARMVTAFRQGLNEAGYVEGRNAAIEFRWAEGHYDRMPAMAAELIRRQVAVIWANTPGVQAAMAATTTIPIVFTVASDPVKDGLVASLNRPGGNVTGVTLLGVEVASKRLELIHELVPTASITALLVNPASPLAEIISTELQAASWSFGLQLRVLHASTTDEIEDAFATLVQIHAGALVIGSDPFFSSRSEQLAALTIRHAVPTIFQDREFVAAGGLMSYGTDIADSYRLAGNYPAGFSRGRSLRTYRYSRQLKSSYTSI
jgi:putative ABC transport system substrate-binding protein